MIHKVKMTVSDINERTEMSKKSQIKASNDEAEAITSEQFHDMFCGQAKHQSSVVTKLAGESSGEIIEDRNRILRFQYFLCFSVRSQGLRVRPELGGSVWLHPLPGPYPLLAPEVSHFIFYLK